MQNTYNVHQTLSLLTVSDHHITRDAPVIWASQSSNDYLAERCNNCNVNINPFHDHECLIPANVMHSKQRSDSWVRVARLVHRCAKRNNYRHTKSGSGGIVDELVCKRFFRRAILETRKTPLHFIFVCWFRKLFVCIFVSDISWWLSLLKQTNTSNVV